MAESIAEFFNDDRLTGTNLRESAKLIHVYLQDNATASETAQSLMAIFGHPEPTATLSEVLEECIVQAAEQLSEPHHVLVSLVMELKAQQQQEGQDDLAIFENSLVMSFGERWSRYGDPDPNGAWKEEERLQWTNLNHFAALLYAGGIDRLMSFGERTLTMTLRKGGWRVNWNDHENTSDSIIALEGHAPAATNWIIISGPRLHHDCSNLKTNWPNLETNLAWIIEKQDLNKDMKSMCSKALQVMSAVDA